MRMQTSIRVEKEFYEEAKEVFKKLGLSFGDAVNIFLAKVAMEKGIPFDLKVPSKELENRINNIENNKNVKTYETTKELFDDLGGALEISYQS
jgi:DNA-damage-inducible protein J